MIQWLQNHGTKKQLWLVKDALNQLLGECNDVPAKKLGEKSRLAHMFVVSVGHGLRSIERQVEEILGVGLEAQMRKYAGGRLRRAFRTVFPLARIPYDMPDPKPPGKTEKDA